MFSRYVAGKARPCSICNQRINRGDVVIGYSEAWSTSSQASHIECIRNYVEGQLNERLAQAVSLNETREKLLREGYIDENQNMSDKAFRWLSDVRNTTGDDDNDIYHYLQSIRWLKKNYAAHKQFIDAMNTNV